MSSLNPASAGAVILLFFGSSCAPFDLPPERLSTGEVTLYTSAPVAFSTELLDQWSGEGRAIDAFLGTPSGGVSTIDYALFDALQPIETACDSALEACAIGTYVASFEPFQKHELAHALIFPRGLPRAVFVEGLAEVVAGNTVDELPIERTLPLEQVGSTDAFRARRAIGRGGFPEAASLVSFLIDRVGMARFMSFYECDEDSDGDLESLDGLSRENLGVAMSALHAEWAALPPEPASAFQRHVYECATPPAVLGEREAVRVVRGVTEADVSWGGVVRTFNVREPSTLGIHAESVSPRLVVGSCDRRPEFLRAHGDARTVDVDSAIEPGRYFLWLEGRFLDPQDAVLIGALELWLEPR